MTNDEELDKYILDSIVPGVHDVGTASMSSRDAKHGVVDPDLRVKGALGLRVVDASVMYIRHEAWFWTTCEKPFDQDAHLLSRRP
ncbi:hypothetical protein DXG01_011383 [Tephrocybe rancida]|nr:hypothetical protein DXG01_011383 [Tephrocybe rancida]